MFEQFKNAIYSIFYPVQHVLENLNTGAIDEENLEAELQRLKILNRQVRRQVYVIEQRVRKIAKTKHGAAS